MTFALLLATPFAPACDGEPLCPPDEEPIVHYYVDRFSSSGEVRGSTELGLPEELRDNGQTSVPIYCVQDSPVSCSDVHLRFGTDLVENWHLTVDLQLQTLTAGLDLTLPSSGSEVSGWLDNGESGEHLELELQAGRALYTPSSDRADVEFEVELTSVDWGAFEAEGRYTARGQERTDCMSMN